MQQEFLHSSSRKADSHYRQDEIERENLLDIEAQDEILIDEKKSTPTIKRTTAYLDGLRGVAALCVYNNHAIGFGDHERGFGADGKYYFISLPFLRVFYNAGAAAVSIFFVLSGFVVTQTIVKLIRDERPGFVKTLSSAAIRRPLRLYLPCWAVAFIIAMALHLPYNIYPPIPWLSAEESIFAELVRWATHCWNFFWPFKKHGSDQAWFIYDLVVWTIPIELKGSFICYALLTLYALANRSFGVRSPIQIWSVGSLMVFVAYLLQTGYWWPACFITGFALSILHAHDLDKPILNYKTTFEIANRRITLPLTTILLQILLIVSWYLLSEPATAGKPEWSSGTPGWHWLSAMIPEVYDKDEFYRYWDSWGAIGFVYATLRTSWIQSILSTRPLQYLGRVSFMLYLVHLPVAYCFSDRWLRVFGHVPFGSDPVWWDNILWLPEWGFEGFNLRYFVMWTTVLSVNLGVAHLLTQYLDDPSVKLGKYLTGLLGLNPPPKNNTDAIRLSTSVEAQSQHH